MNMKTNAVDTTQSIDNTGTDGTMEQAFQTHLDENYEGIDISSAQVEELKFVFYSGAQAFLNTAVPLSRMAPLMAELDEYLNADGEVPL